MKKVFAISIIATLLLCSCSGANQPSNNTAVTTTVQNEPESQSTASAATSGTTQPAAATDSIVEIGYMTWNGGAQQTSEEAFFRQYEIDNPNIKINDEFITWDNYYPKLNTLMAAGECTDIFFTAESQLIDYAEKGMALDLNSLYANEGISMKDTFAEGCYYESDDGKIWSLSNGLSGIVLYYNKELFAELGVEPPSLDANNPWTWDQFREAAIMLTTDNDGNTPLDSGFNPDKIKTFGTFAPTHRNALIPLLYTNNAAMLDHQGGVAKGMALNTPEAKTVLQAVADLIYVDRAAPAAAIADSLPGAVQMFKDKQLGMRFDGAWMYINYVENNVDVGVSPIPMFSKPASVFWGSAYMLSSQSKNPEVAFKVFKDFLDPEVFPDQMKFMLPSKKDLYEGEKMQSWIDNDFYNSDFQKVLPGMVKTNLPGEMVFVRDFSKIIDETIMPIMDKFWLGEASLDDALTEADAAARDLYG